MNDWLIPLTVLSSGAIAGAIFALRTRKVGEPVTAAGALAAERDAVLAELHVLTDESQRSALELRAATLWRDLDRLQKKSKPAPARPVPGLLRGFAWGAGIVVAVALIVAFVQHNSKPKAVAPPESSWETFTRLMTEDPAGAEVVLRQTLEADADRLDAWVHLSLLYLQTGRVKEAMDAYNQATTLYPGQAAALQPLLDEIRAAGGTAFPAISGVLELDPKVKFTPGAVVFVVARAAEGGPPIAVAKLRADSFPLPFTLSAHRSMTGGSLPEKVRVEARIDSDGDAVTRSPSDPSGTVDQIALGQAGVRIKLR